MFAAVRKPLAFALVAILACAVFAAAPMTPMRPIGGPVPAAAPPTQTQPATSGSGSSSAPVPPAPPAATATAIATIPDSGKGPAWTVCPAPGKFITCLLGTDSALWVGTEDASLWRLDLAADPTQPSSWRQFTTADTHTDNIYGLAEDAAGRLWVGTQNQGVSVYNGKEWRNYGVIDGPIGEHVFAIAADPGFIDPAAVNPDSIKATLDKAAGKPDVGRAAVWIATDHGLTSWTPSANATTTASSPNSSLAAGLWRHFTKADGLPSSQIYAVTVDAKGRVFAGTECDGMAWSDPPYNKWQAVRAEYERSGDGASGGRPMTAMSAGGAAGLPSNLSNFLLALPDGSVAYPAGGY
jgi:hypothetical protein